jgi:hypothetical protein
MLVKAIEAFTGRWNQNAAPFEWTKHEVHQQEMKHSYADLCKKLWVDWDQRLRMKLDRPNDSGINWSTFVVARLVLGNSIFGVRLSLKPYWNRSHLLGVAGNPYVLSGYFERVTGRQLRIRKNRRGLLGRRRAERETTKG